ncbi:MBL fold metallo-hydrolase [Micromonospora profundi]
MPVALADLPRLDAIIISHDHYGHLGMPTIRALNHTQEAILAAHPRRHRVSPLRSRVHWQQRNPVEFVNDRRQHRLVFYTGDSGSFDGSPTSASGMVFST